MKIKSKVENNSLAPHWDEMKSKYPLVIKTNAEEKNFPNLDSTRIGFLKYVDGVKSSEEVRDYFMLSSSDAHYILSDLLNMGALRLIDGEELLAYWSAQNLELERELEFHRSNKEKLEGEHFYLSNQIERHSKIIQSSVKRSPILSNLLKQLSGKTQEVSTSALVLWEFISELSLLAQDIRSFSEKTKETIKVYT